jgi:riboflavin transporter FmnP
MKLKRMNTIALMSVIAFLLQFIEMPLLIFPAFLKIDLSDIPALIVGFSFGPLAGVAVEGLKNVIHLLKTSTAGVGELANFIIGASMVAPAAWIYRKNHNKKGAFIGLVVGTIVMSVVGALANYFILIPFYAKLYQIPMDAIIGMGTAVNKSIVDMWTLILYGIVPFNLIKGILISVVTLLIYKKVRVVIMK